MRIVIREVQIKNAHEINVNALLKQINPPKINNEDSKYCHEKCPHFDFYRDLCTLFNESVTSNRFDEYERCSQCHNFTKLLNGCKNEN